MKRKLLKSFVLSLALASAIASAQACIVQAPFVLEDIKAADVVFTGNVTGYSVEGCPLDQSPTLDCYVLLDVDVSETLYGEARLNWKLYWWNSTFGFPEDEKFENSFIFAGRWSNGNQLPMRTGSATVFASKRPELLQVLQAPCSSAFILRPTTETLNSVRNLIAEKIAAEKNQ